MRRKVSFITRNFRLKYTKDISHHEHSIENELAFDQLKERNQGTNIASEFKWFNFKFQKNKRCFADYN